MDPDRSRILADLSGVLSGEVRCDDAFLQMYASDASIYQITPLAVVRPTGVADVVACVNYASENQLSIIPRGAGSNVVGGAIGNGIVLDFSSAMRRVISLDDDTVTIQPGVVLQDLNRQLATRGRHFGPDPATRAFTTMGGVLAMNSTGSRWNRYGDPRSKVLSMRVVLASGEVIRVNANGNAAADKKGASERTRLLEGRVASIVKQNQELIQDHKPDAKINEAGYNLFDVEVDDGIDLTRLLVGSEGTLGIITEATLQTEPLARHRGAALLFFDRLAGAAEAALIIAEMDPVACDLVDRRLLSIARETGATYQRLIPAEAECMLLVEFQSDEEATLRDKLEKLVSRIQRKKKLAFDVRTTTTAEQRDVFWHLVRRIVPIQYRLGGQRRAIPFVEDIVLAPEKLPGFLQELHGILNQHEVTASVFAHMLQGHMHIRPLVNMADEAEFPKMQALANQLFDRVIKLNGTISGGYGDGLSRTWYLKHQYGRLYNVFSEIKNVFDPQNILNPGKIVNHPHYGLTDNIRPVNAAAELLPVDDLEATLLEVAGINLDGTAAEKSYPSVAPPTTMPKAVAPASKKPRRASLGLPVIQPELVWDVSEIAKVAQACNGCGRCRTHSSRERMCPMFRVAPLEEASPRSKANLIRSIVTGQLDPKNLATDDFKSIVDLCVNCHQCRLDCPASVDVPKLMVEAKAQYIATNGLRLSDWLLTRLDWLYSVAGRMPRLTNVMMRNPTARWLLDRLLGIAQGRKLPPFSHTSFARWAQRQRLDRPSSQAARKVVYFVDAYANWNDVELAKAFLAVLKHNGIDVVVPNDQMVSGMSMISDGAIGRARRIAERNVECLAEWVRQGYQVITTEPSAALALKHEYLNILDDEDARVVANATIDATTFLSDLHLAGSFALDFRPLNVSIGYHLPCHQRALGNDAPAVRLLRLIPGLQVEMINEGCSGMAGTYGLKRKNYKRSLRMGFALINAMRSPAIIAGTTECSTCKIQMEQGTTRPTVHPIKILAMAYGVMPELDDLFQRRSGERVTSC